jgi:peptidoglycan hydrolase-like protein with peptidoglycan-binding domain
VIQTPVTTGTKAVLGEKLTRLDELIAKLKPNKVHKDVPELQKELQKLGFFPKNLKFTTYYGVTTQASVKKYQVQKKASAVVITPSTTSTLSLLEALIAKTKFGQTSKDVKQLQLELQKAGFYSKKLAATGYYGKTTQLCVQNYLASKKKK